MMPPHSLKVQPFINVVTGKYFKGFNHSWSIVLPFFLHLLVLPPEKGEFLGEFCGLQFPLGIWVPPCVLWTS